MIKIVMYFFAIGIPLEGPVDIYEGKGACTKVEMEQIVSKHFGKAMPLTDVYENKAGSVTGVTGPINTTKVTKLFLCEEVL